MDRSYTIRKKLGSNQIIWGVFTLLLAISSCKSAKDKLPEERAQAILNEMSLEEKAGQMTQLSIEMILQGKDQFNLTKPHALDTVRLRKVLVEMGVGSILNVPGNTFTLAQWKEVSEALHAYRMQTRLQIPVLYGIDAIHGANYTVGATLYPQQINLAASFNTDLIAEMATNTANDVRASGLAWNFSPVLDVARNPRWPRFWETFGEDPMVASCLGSSMVKAYQMPSKNGLPGVAACLKHYVGYGDARSGMDRTPAYIPERQLREIFLPPFAQAIEAGAQTIMINSGEVNGEPVHASKFLLQTILREELKFKGITVTDWEDIKNLYERHKIVSTYKEAVAVAINAGIDMAMVPLDTLFTHYLIENVKEGNISMTRINQSVLRILTLKFKLGLFEHSPANSSKYDSIGSDQSKKLSLALATQSLVLLKNSNQALPLSPTEKILVTGANAHYINALNGGWTHTWQGRDTTYNSEVPTCLEALQNIHGMDKVVYLPGNTYDTNLSDEALLAAAKNIASVVLFLGEDTYTEKPGDILDLELSAAQQHLIKVYKQAGKKVIVVLLEGRPRTFANTESLCDAIIFAGLPGDAGGTAIANVLCGLSNPSGKLPFTYPRYSGFHLTYDCKYTEVLNKDFKPLGFNPLFEFGSGLSYTGYVYSNFTCDKESYTLSDTIKMNVTISNTGNMEGLHTALFYSKDEVASITPSVKKLRAFRKIFLRPGASEIVSIELPVQHLAFVGLSNKWGVEPGSFKLSVDTLSQNITITNQ